MSAAHGTGLPHLDQEHGSLLCRIADSAIRTALRTGRRPEPDTADTAGAPEPLREPGACFVTLTRNRSLLGCIGSMRPYRPLCHDVALNALAAAFDDPRLPVLAAEQFRETTIEVSVLSPLVPLEVGGPAELEAVIRPGVDGLFVSAPGRRGTFLPSVWEQLPSPRAFLDALWRKSGMPPGAWPAGITVHRYTTTVFHDEAPRPEVVTA